MSKHYVLDSYAILTLLNDELGAERVEAILRLATEEKIVATMSLINLGEIAYIVERRWGESRVKTLLAYLESINLQMARVDYPRVMAAAHIKAKHPLSYADAFAAALTQELNAILITGDPEFKAVETIITIEWLPRE